MDAVDLFTAQWAAERPDVDPRPLAVWGRLKRAADLLDSTLSEALEEHELNLAEFEVLAALVRNGSPYELRPTELAQSLIITAGAVTARLTHLERRGFISRRRDDSDRRVQLVILTARGLVAFEPAFEAVTRKTSEVIESIGPEDGESLFGSLRSILAVLDPFDAEDIPSAVESSRIR